MKSTGIVRKLDGLGRLVIPIETRRSMALEEGDSMEIFTDGNKIIFQKYGTCCHCCGSEKIDAEVLGISLCSDCIDDFISARELIDRVVNRSEKK
ncbi:MAG: AbrB/MazE/SpoVT family DNA-binding domain-containing protein [Cetobacterium sp.]